MARKRQKNKKTKAMGKIFHSETIVDGIKFHSKTEAEYYKYLMANKEQLNIKEVELQPQFTLMEKFILTPSGERIDYIDDSQFKKEQKRYPKCTHQSMKYIADFLITYKNDKVEVVDIKGIKTADFRIKEKMFNYLYPQYKGLKCIVSHKGEWLLWEDYKKAKKTK